MSGTVNKVILVGRLGQDPELRFTPSGAGVCNFSIATDKYGKPQEGKPTADFHKIVVWNQNNRKLAELCAQYLRKGAKAYVEGRLQTRTYSDKDTGKTMYVTEVHAFDVQFLSDRNEGQGNGGNANGAPAQTNTPPTAALPQLTPEQTAAASEIDPDDIPF